jgi:hypothetical protein
MIGNTIKNGLIKLFIINKRRKKLLDFFNDAVYIRQETNTLQKIITNHKAAKTQNIDFKSH